MPSDAPLRIDATAVRVACGPHGCAFASRRGLVARIDDALAYTGPVIFGLAAWAAAFRVGGLMRWVKPTDNPYSEPDYPC